MCGRYTLTTPGELLAEELALDSAPEVAPRYNIAPTQESLIVVAQERVEGDPARLATRARWGFAGGGGRLLINARSETVDHKPAFRESYARRRCLVPADGFYEWKGARGRRQPIYFTRSDGRPMAFAGLWERLADGRRPQTRDPGDERNGPGAVFTILTTVANDRVARVHDRMPVILDPTSFSLWLSPATPAGRLAGVLAPAPESTLTERPVSRTVNDVRVDSPACLEAPRDFQLSLLTGDGDEL